MNTGDIALQSVLLWKAYLGNNRSKVVLVVGCMPLIGIAVFIFINITIGRSDSKFGQGVCSVEYRKYPSHHLSDKKDILNINNNNGLQQCTLLSSRQRWTFHPTRSSLGVSSSSFTDTTRFLTRVFKKHCSRKGFYTGK